MFPVNWRFVVACSDHRCCCRPPVTLSDLQHDLQALAQIVLGQTRQYETLKELIMATADEVVSRLDAATNEVAADLTSLRDELAQVLADQDVEKQAAVDAALAKFDAPIARLEALGADPSNPDPEGHTEPGDGSGEVPPAA